MGYEIKRGEQLTLPLVISNDEAARILLAFDLEQPWACHQSYRLFDELHGEIFGRPEVDAHRIRALFEAYGAVITVLPQLSNQLLAGYRLSRFLFLYLLRRALETDDMGKAFARRPQDFVTQHEGLKRLGSCLTALLGDLIVDVNAELKERNDAGNSFDYKRELKSPSSVRAFAQQIVPMYEKAVRRGRVNSFAQEWEASGSSTP